MRPIDLQRSDQGHSAPITHVAFRPDGLRLATCSYDGTVLVWDVQDPREPVPLTRLRHRRLVNSSAWHPSEPDVLATASADKTAAIWRVSDVGDAELMTVLARHTDDVNSLAWTPDGNRIVSVSEDGRAALWDAHSGEFLAEVSSHTAHCMMVSVSPLGVVATVGEDGQVIATRVGDTDSAGSISYDSSIEGCAWSHSGRELAIARDDGNVVLLSDDLNELLVIDVADSAARTVDWARDDSRIVVGTYDGSVCCYERTGALVWRVADERQWPRSIAIGAGVVAVGSFHNRPHLLESSTGSEVSGPDRAHHGPNAMTARSGHLFIGCDSGAVIEYDLRNGSTRLWPLVAGPILSIGASEEALFVGTYSGHVHRVVEGYVTHTRKLDAPVPSVCVFEDVCVAGTYNGSMFALRLSDLDEIEQTSPHGGSVKSIAVGEGSLVSGATDKQVATGSMERRRPLWAHGNLVNSVSALGDVVASASRDHTVKVGRESGGPVKTLLGPDESVKCVGLMGSADDLTVVAGSYDFKVYAWHLDLTGTGSDHGQLLDGRPVIEFDQAVSCLAPIDRSRVAVASWDGTVAVLARGEGRVLDLVDRIDLENKDREQQVAVLR